MAKYVPERRIKITFRIEDNIDGQLTLVKMIEPEYKPRGNARWAWDQTPEALTTYQRIELTEITLDGVAGLIGEGAQLLAHYANRRVASHA